MPELVHVIKAIAHRARHRARDAEDIYRRLEVADAYPTAEIGGWQLASPASARMADMGAHG